MASKGSEGSGGPSTKNPPPQKPGGASNLEAQSSGGKGPKKGDPSNAKADQPGGRGRGRPSKEEKPPGANANPGTSADQDDKTSSNARSRRRRNRGNKKAQDSVFADKTTPPKEEPKRFTIGTNAKPGVSKDDERGRSRSSSRRTNSRSSTTAKETESANAGVTKPTPLASADVSMATASAASLRPGTSAQALTPAGSAAAETDVHMTTAPSIADNAGTPTPAINDQTSSSGSTSAKESDNGMEVDQMSATSSDANATINSAKQDLITAIINEGISSLGGVFAKPKSPIPRPVIDAKTATMTGQESNSSSSVNTVIEGSFITERLPSSDSDSHMEEECERQAPNIETIDLTKSGTDQKEADILATSSKGSRMEWASEVDEIYPLDHEKEDDQVMEEIIKKQPDIIDVLETVPSRLRDLLILQREEIENKRQLGNFPLTEEILLKKRHNLEFAQAQSLYYQEFPAEAPPGFKPYVLMANEPPPETPPPPRKEDGNKTNVVDEWPNDRVQLIVGIPTRDAVLKIMVDWELYKGNKDWKPWISQIRASRLKTATRRLKRTSLTMQEEWFFFVIRQQGPPTGSIQGDDYVQFVMEQYHAARGVEFQTHLARNKIQPWKRRIDSDEEFKIMEGVQDLDTTTGSVTSTTSSKRVQSESPTKPPGKRERTSTVSEESTGEVDLLDISQLLATPREEEEGDKSSEGTSTTTTTGGLPEMIHTDPTPPGGRVLLEEEDPTRYILPLDKAYGEHEVYYSLGQKDYNFWGTDGTFIKRNPSLNLPFHSWELKIPNVNESGGMVWYQTCYVWFDPDGEIRVRFGSDTNIESVTLERANEILEGHQLPKILWDPIRKKIEVNMALIKLREQEALLERQKARCRKEAHDIIDIAREDERAEAREARMKQTPAYQYELEQQRPKPTFGATDIRERPEAMAKMRTMLPRVSPTEPQVVVLGETKEQSERAVTPETPPRPRLYGKPLENPPEWNNVMDKKFSQPPVPPEAKKNNVSIRAIYGNPHIVAKPYKEYVANIIEAWGVNADNVQVRRDWRGRYILICRPEKGRGTRAERKIIELVEQRPFRGHDFNDVFYYWKQHGDRDLVRLWNRDAGTHTMILMGRWFDNWIANEWHPMPMPDKDPKQLTKHELTVWYVKLDIWQMSAVRPEREDEYSSDSWQAQAYRTFSASWYKQNKYYQYVHEWETAQAFKVPTGVPKRTTPKKRSASPSVGPRKQRPPLQTPTTYAKAISGEKAEEEYIKAKEDPAVQEALGVVKGQQPKPKEEVDPTRALAPKSVQEMVEPFTLHVYGPGDEKTPITYERWQTILQCLYNALEQLILKQGANKDFLHLTIRWDKGRGCGVIIGTSAAQVTYLKIHWKKLSQGIPSRIWGVYEEPEYKFVLYIPVGPASLATPKRILTAVRELNKPRFDFLTDQKIESVKEFVTGLGKGMSAYIFTCSKENAENLLKGTEHVQLLIGFAIVRPASDPAPKEFADDIAHRWAILKAKDPNKADDDLKRERAKLELPIEKVLTDNPDEDDSAVASVREDLRKADPNWMDEPKLSGKDTIEFLKETIPRTAEQVRRREQVLIREGRADEISETELHAGVRRRTFQKEWDEQFQDWKGESKIPDLDEAQTAEAIEKVLEIMDRELKRKKLDAHDQQQKKAKAAPTPAEAAAAQKQKKKPSPSKPEPMDTGEEQEELTAPTREERAEKDREYLERLQQEEYERELFNKKLKEQGLFDVKRHQDLEKWDQAETLRREFEEFLVEKGICRPLKRRGKMTIQEKREHWLRAGRGGQTPPGSPKGSYTKRLEELTASQRERELEYSVPSTSKGPTPMDIEGFPSIPSGAEIEEEELLLAKMRSIETATEEKEKRKGTFATRGAPIPKPGQPLSYVGKGKGPGKGASRGRGRGKKP